MEENQKTPLYVRVVTIKDNGVKSTKIIVHNNYEDRKWLGKHCFWAFRNGVEIHISAV